MNIRSVIIFTVIFLISTNVGLTQITTSGVLTGDETWSGTVNVLGDVTVPGGITLNIESGTVVKFAANSDDKGSGDDPNRCELIVSGTLTALGTVDDMILFTSTANTPGDWHTITIASTSRGSIIDYCRIEYAASGVNIGGSRITISNSIFTNGIGRAISLRGVTKGEITKNTITNYFEGAPSSAIWCYKSSPMITNNVIDSIGWYGIEVAHDSSPVIDGNTITNNNRRNNSHGVRIHSGSSPIIRNNLISNNHIGIGIEGTSAPNLGNLSNPDPTDSGGNQIYDNGINVLNITPNLIMAEGNYWGTTDLTLIDSYIRDDDEDPLFGPVDFEPLSATVSIETEEAVHKGNSFLAMISMENAIDLAGFQLDISFDPTILEAIQVDEGTFLSKGGRTFWLDPGIDNTTGVITAIVCARISGGSVEGSNTLATITFKAIDAGESYIRFQNIILSDSSGGIIPAASLDGSATVTEFPPWDVNMDGVVDILDLVLIGQNFGVKRTTPLYPNPDVNGDGVANIADIVLVGQHFGEVYSPAAPPGIWNVDPQYLPILTMIYNLMEDNPSSDPDFLATKLLLHRLIFSAGVERTELLQNYPNPFNPETWIPYQLAEDADVMIRIYSTAGQLIRTIDLSYRCAGIYTDKDSAAYWDGMTDDGEYVSSGVYFYSIQAGDYSATMKMIVVR